MSSTKETCNLCFDIIKNVPDGGRIDICPNGGCRVFLHRRCVKTMLANNYKQCVICKEDNGPLVSAFVKKENELLMAADQHKKAKRNAKDRRPQQPPPLPALNIVVDARVAFFMEAGMSPRSAAFEAEITAV